MTEEQVFSISGFTEALYVQTEKGEILQMLEIIKVSFNHVYDVIKSER